MKSETLNGVVEKIENNEYCFTHKELAIARVLAENYGQIVSYQEIFRKVWQDTTVRMNNLTVGICGMRQKMGEDKIYVASVTGAGYALKNGRTTINTSKSITIEERFIIHSGTHEIEINYNIKALSRKEFGLLTYFVQNPNNTLTYADISLNVWDEKILLKEQSIRRYVVKLRRKLEDRKGYIVSVIGSGYRFERKGS